MHFCEELRVSNHASNGKKSDSAYLSFSEIGRFDLFLFDIQC